MVHAADEPIRRSDDTPQKRATRNKYYSRRRGSIAADPVDDDNVRDEINRLTFTEEQLRHELLQAVVSSNYDSLLSSLNAAATSASSVPNLHPASQDDTGNHNTVHGTTNAEISPSVANSANDSTDIGIEVEEELQPRNDVRQSRTKPKNNRPWYFGVLRRQKKPEKLQDEIRRQKELLRRSLKTIDEGYEDVMDCQTETQQVLIKQSMEAIQNDKAK